MLLLDCILNGKLSKPFTQAPPDYDLPILNKSEVLSQLSLNFKEFSKKCFSEDSKDNQKYDNFKENFNPQIVYRSMNQNSAQKLSYQKENSDRYLRSASLQTQKFPVRKGSAKLSYEKDISYNGCDSLENRKIFDCTLYKRLSQKGRKKRGHTKSSVVSQKQYQSLRSLGMRKSIAEAPNPCYQSALAALEEKTELAEQQQIEICRLQREVELLRKENARLKEEKKVETCPELQITEEEKLRLIQETEMLLNQSKAFGNERTQMLHTLGRDSENDHDFNYRQKDYYNSRFYPRYREDLYKDYY